MKADILSQLQPQDLDLDPEQFPSFRAEQLEACEQAVYGEERFQAICAPGGLGKSLLAWMIAKLSGEKSKTLILTRDHGLSDQYNRDFEKYGLVDIRGRSNYDCVEGGNCDEGARSECEACFAKPSGCTYALQRQAAIAAQVKITNYKYYLHSGIRQNGGLGYIDTLICDEAHFISSEALSFMQVQLWEHEIKKLMHGVQFPQSEDVGEWRQWAGLNLASVKSEIQAWRERIKLLRVSRVPGALGEIQKIKGQLRRLEELAEKLADVDSTVDDSWVMERHEGGQWGRSWTFDPLWAGQFAERLLWRGVPKVVLMSATLNRETLKMLGVRREESRLSEWRRIFPANRNPIYLLPTYKEVPRTAKNPEGRVGISVNYGITDEDMRRVVETMDRFIDLRLDRKGLIQTVSYRRQQKIMELSRHRGLMIGNTQDPESEDAREIAEKFRAADAPKILVSPSFGTGWDFKYRACEFIVLLNIPFKPAQTKIAKARYEKYPRLRDYEALQEMWQSTFRGMRAQDDQLEVVLLDGRSWWFISKTKDLSPKGYYDIIRRVNEQPKPLEKIRK